CRLEVLGHELRDVPAHVLGSPVADSGAHRDGLEASGMWGEKRGNAATLGPADCPETIRIDHTSGNQRIDAAHHVPHVSDAEITHGQRTKLRTEAGAPAVVGLEHQSSL